MKRLRRWLLDGVTVLSVMLILGMGILCVRAFWANDGFCYRSVDGPSRDGEISTWAAWISTAGVNPLTSQISITVERMSGIRGMMLGGFSHWQKQGMNRSSRFGGNAPAWLERLGFGGAIGSSQRRQGPAVRREFRAGAFAPTWFLFLATAVFPCTWVALRVRSRRRRNASHLCVRCGYDLRATPDRCPECGTIRSGPSS